MNPLIFKYELDLSGASTKNRVVSEYHDLRSLTGKSNRPFCLDYGYFYSDTVIVRDVNGIELRVDVDYQTTGLHPEATTRTGKEICCIIVVTNPRVGEAVYVSAQMVGGQYTTMATTIVQLATSVLNDDRAVRWSNIVNRPDAFTPGGHLHALWELYGFDPYNDRLEDIIQALMEKSGGRIDVMYEDMVAKYAALTQERNIELSRLIAHVQNTNNPHRVTQQAVGLGLLNNYPMASMAEASVVGGGRNDRYTTPRTTKQLIDVNFLAQLTQHINNTTNSTTHRVTPAQAGTLSKRDSDLLLQTRLGVSDTAVATARLQGMTYSEMYSDARANLPASAVTSGRLALSNLGNGSVDRNRVLVGNSQWRSITELVSLFIDSPPGVYFIGFLGYPPDAAAHVSATYSDINAYPVGTIVMYREMYQRTAYAGNGNLVTTYHVMKAMLRTPSGWVGPH